MSCYYPHNKNTNSKLKAHVSPQPGLLNSLQRPNKSSEKENRDERTGEKMIFISLVSILSCVDCLNIILLIILIMPLLMIISNGAEEDQGGYVDPRRPDGQLDGVRGSVADGREEEAIAHSNKA